MLDIKNKSMTKKQITEGNRLIAEFIGDKIMVETDGIAIISEKNGMWFSGTKRLEDHHEKCYHSSWDWLMPVLPAILRIEFTIPHFNLPMVNAQERFNTEVYRSLYYKTPMEVFDYVVTFLKIYEINK
jgi:hypothetical protein